tara:strand:- start:3319 stop:3636 length:318 start_codon:yes stop_codon:yes gene_type:complete
MIRIAKNGCSSVVEFKTKEVFFEWHYGPSKDSLGKKLDILTWMQTVVSDETWKTKSKVIQDFMIDWELYENGWYINTYKNPRLFYYLEQTHGYSGRRPKELDYFN